jgi:hypothetical protein
MTLEEIKNLGAQDLNKHLAEKCLGWRRYFRDRDKNNSDEAVLQPPNQKIITPDKLVEVPRFCEDLNVVAGAEKIVVEKVGLEKYGIALSLACETWDCTSTREAVGKIAIASGRHRAEACLYALHRDEEDNW